MITVNGELDLASSGALEQELVKVSEGDFDQVIIDLRKLEFMDSTGLSTLVRAQQRTEECGRAFALVKGPQQVQRLLSLTGFADRIRLVEAPEELLEA